MMKPHSPTASSPLWAVFLPHIHANTVHASALADSDTGLTLSIILLIVGLLIIIGSFIWQYKIDKDKRKW